MCEKLSYQQRLNKLRETKMNQTEDKVRKMGRVWDSDDKGFILPPDDFSFKPEFNHPTGGFFGPKACGRNFRKLLESHPVYIDSMSSLAGGWMIYMSTYRETQWNPEYDFSHLYEEQKRYDLVHGIGASHHFTADVKIGFELGWRGILEKIKYYRSKHDATHYDFYHGLEDTVLGIQEFILRHSEAAEKLLQNEKQSDIRDNLESIVKMNHYLATEPPRTFIEACQWLAWFIVTFDIYNGCGAAVGAIDELLKPFYDRDIAAGILDEEDAIFHLACLLLKDNAYYQIGGSDENGNDKTNELSFFMLEAAHRLKIPTSICVRVHKKLNPNLMEMAVKYLFEDKRGTPNFLGDESMNQGFMKNGYPLDLAVNRVKSGCHWCAIPGREYTLNDCVKINFVAVFEVALKEMISDKSIEPSVNELWSRFEKHLKRSVKIIAEGLDFHLEHMHNVFPELTMDLLCHGPIEKGLDATHGGVEFYNMCVDGAGLAVVADSFAALKQRIENEKRLNWSEMISYLESDFKDAEDIRLMLKSTPHYGSGNSCGDEFASKIIKSFVQYVKEGPTPKGYNMIPGIFSWANTIPMGLTVGATPNGRHAMAPISHGANPEPGFRESGALTAMGLAVASVQCGYGNTVPIQLEVDPMLGKSIGGQEKIITFINTYCNDLGGTLLNLNIIDKDKILDAHKDPSKYPDLIVRVTGFSAYFATLSEKFRQLVVDRIISGL